MLRGSEVTAAEPETVTVTVAVSVSETVAATVAGILLLGVFPAGVLELMSASVTRVSAVFTALQ